MSRLRSDLHDFTGILASTPTPREPASHLWVSVEQV